MALTEKQKIFVNEYLVDLNATRAYKAAYPKIKSDDVAAVNGSRLLRNANIVTYIKQRMETRKQRTEVTQDMVIRELAAIAFAKATDYAEVKDGNVKIRDTAGLSEEQIKAIAGIKEGKFGVEVKLNDKEKALELLGRHLGMFNDRVEISGLEEEKSKLDNILKQMRGGG